MATITDSHKQNRPFIEEREKNLLRATWLLESKTLIWSPMFSTTDVYFLDSEPGLENINLKKSFT